ncbi:RsmB/NOP family class I SAM-dependent RNA methyltransferase [Aureimonas altamirensis]|uniref:RsmB/NOP family class I SAM-dependent RNA methyltransferase n=1 Tax=Aureimonas altamirensis TaxID=370622 RepID=UPI0020368DA4|nr:RsmB/NOP family class I SAM-dependent RNA methyltransferase [Aureimonas altamirensis]MCM2505911.1 RsmB/NOP family class I SAM-dependent RNA methyltransferase [Aureimonas altamirensis]
MRLGGRIAAAIEIIEDMDSRRRPVADALKDWGLSHRFAGSGDRAAIGNIVYDVLRRRRSLGWRMGDDTPRALAFAAVVDAGLPAQDLSVALAGDRFAPQMPASDGFVRLTQAPLSDAPDAVAADVPDWLAVPLARSLGDEWVAEARAMGDRPPLDMRVNTLRANRDEVLEKLRGFGAVPTPYAPQGLRIPPIQGDGRHPNVQVEEAFQTGLFEIQDEGSQIAALLAGARPGISVLDYCAGAGGKTLALAADMAGEGAVHAYDADRQRLAPIWERLRRAGAEAITVHAPRDDLSSLAGSMDLVLVDAPCTGSGTWRRRPDARWRLTEQQLHRRMAEQDKVLSAAAQYVRPGGHLAYVTCSVLEEENGARVARFVDTHPQFRVEDASTLWQTAIPQPGAPYIPVDVAGGRAMTMTPHRTGTDGFFFARLTRVGAA